VVGGASRASGAVGPVAIHVPSAYPADLKSSYISEKVHPYAIRLTTARFFYGC